MSLLSIPKVPRNPGGASLVIVFALGVLLVVLPRPGHAQEDLSVLGEWLTYAPLDQSLYHRLATEGTRQIERRNQTVDDLVSRRDWTRRQEAVRARLRNLIGPFPARTPLRARVVDTLDRDGYRVEHVLYESVPGVSVTGSLFVPDTLDAPAPAVLYLSGHTSEAYRNETYQHVILNLVQKGFVVMAIDPVGQGERRLYVEAGTGESALGGATDQHSYFGAQSFLTGRSPAWIFAWDGIRALDYLEGRTEVDPARIGVTGRSGGGTQTAYLAALDDRVRAAAPENYITSFRRLLQSIGPQDAEQNVFHGLARGLDHADLLTVRAPRPTLMITTTRDFFSIQGARETAREVERAYTAFGASDHFRMVSDDAPHTSTASNREALYAFLRRHLDHPGSVEDREVDLIPQQDLEVTETGQVETSLEGRTPFELVRARAARQITTLDSARQNLSAHLPSAVRSARSLSGYRGPPGTEEVLFTGRHQRSGYVIEEYALQRPEAHPLPLLLFRPAESGPHPGLLYLHPDGKTAEAGPGGQIEAYVEAGYAVLAPDLPGRGELGPGLSDGDSVIGGTSFNEWFASVLTGRSIVGLRAEDLTQLARHLRRRPAVQDEEVTSVAVGHTAPTLLHAAAFSKHVGPVALMEPLLSYGALATHERYAPQFIPGAVAGALTGYDLPDLAASLAPRSLLLLRPLEPEGGPADPETVTSTYEVVRRAYADRDASAKLQIRPTVDSEPMRARVLEWLRARK